MHNTGNPLGSTQVLDLYDNSENIDYFANSQLDEHPDRFGTKRLTLAGLIKRSMALRNEINDFSGAMTFKPEWTDVPMNVSEGVGGEGGALNLQAEALGNRSEINKITSREALRRTYLEVGLNLVGGSFETGGTLVNTNDVLLHESSGKAYSGPAGAVAAGTNPTVGGFVDRSSRDFSVRLSAFIPPLIDTETVDCAGYIKEADEFAKSRNKSLYFDGVTYLIKQHIPKKTNWYGVVGKTKLLISPDFTYNAQARDPVRYSAITNENCATRYDSLTADNFVIRGIDIVDYGGSLGANTVSLANVRRGVISDCNWTTSASNTKTLLDVHACVKNLTVNRCSFNNLTEHTSGGCVWVRNITSDGSINENTTENIRFNDSIFVQTSIDEAFAVYGVFGPTRNIRVSRCTFDGTLRSVNRHGNLVTCFPLGNTQFAEVSDVIFSGCTLKSNNFINHIYRVGSSNDTGNVCKDIHMVDCSIIASLPTISTSAIVRNIPCKGGNVTISNSTLDAERSVQTITYGAQGFDIINNVTVTGNINTGLISNSVVDGCVTKNIKGTSASNCSRVVNSNLSSAVNGVTGNNTTNYYIANNTIEITSTSDSGYGILLNSISSSTPYGMIANNTINVAGAGGTAIGCTGAGVVLTQVIDNTHEGTGKTIIGSQFKEVRGNNWKGSLDSMRNAGYLDYDHNRATPIGTFCTAMTHTLVGTRYLLGFIKTDNAGSGSDWKVVYVESGV